MEYVEDDSVDFRDRKLLQRCEGVYNCLYDFGRILEIFKSIYNL